MAAVPIVINNAVIIDYYDRVIGGPFKIVGNAARSDVGIGGGPVIPPEGGEKPPWLPGYRPEHPIVLPPIFPGGPPIDIGAHPEHPIVIPPPPDTTPAPPGMAVKPPPPDGGWAYVQPWGWGYFPPATQAGPKK